MPDHHLPPADNGEPSGDDHDPNETAAADPVNQDQNQDQDQQSPSPADDAWSRLRRGFLQPGRSQIILALVLGLFAIGVVTQVRAQSSGEAYETARRADLVQLADGLAEETRRLESEIAELEATRRELESGSDARQVAREEARSRLDALSVLAGTVPAQGPGIRITITDPQLKVGAGVLLNALGELRDAGAEVIEFNDTVRVTASTWVGGTPGALVVDGTTVPRVIVLEVIGDPHSLEEAVRFRGGLVTEVTAPNVGGAINVERQDVIEVQSTARVVDHEFARPAR